MKKNIKNITLADTDTWYNMLSDNDCIAEYMEENGIEDKDDINKAEFTDWCVEQANENYYQDLDGLSSAVIEYDKPCLLMGSVGMWCGCKTIFPLYFDCLDDAVARATRDSDYNDVKITYNGEKGIIEIECSHHDGTNCFEVHLISAKGFPIIDRHRDCDDYITDIEVKPYMLKRYNLGC